MSTNPRPASSVFDLAKSAAKPAGASGGKRGGAQTPLPPLPTASLKFERGIPVAPRIRGGERGVSKYDAIFDPLEVGMSVKLPVVYAGAVNAYAKKLAKAKGGEYTVRKISATECRLWRTA